MSNNNNNHWLLMGGLIVARVKSVDSVSEIAFVKSERAVRQLLRYAELGEQCEHIADRLGAMTLTPQQAAVEIDKLVSECIRDVSVHGAKVRCPEILGGRNA